MTDDCTCIGIVECTQDPNDNLPYIADFEEALTRFRVPAQTYATGVRVRSKASPGLQFNASTGGRTGNAEPRWPTAVGGTVPDGSVIWTAEAISTVSLTSTLSGAAWSADTGITTASQVESGQKSQVYVSGGGDGQTYSLLCTGTMADGTKMTGVFSITVERKKPC